jgi:putative membrane protein
VVASKTVLTSATLSGVTADRPRRPRRVYVGDEPDPRYSLANERTFLAWVRTTLAVVAGAVALESLELPRQAGHREALVLTLLGFAAATMVLAYARWRRVERAMRLGEPLPPFRLGLVVTVAIVVVIVLLGAITAW